MRVFQFAKGYLVTGSVVNKSHKCCNPSSLHKCHIKSGDGDAMTEQVEQLKNGWSVIAVDQLQQQRNEAMSLMEQALNLMSQAIRKAPSLSFESVLANNYWYSNGRFEQLKESLDHALDQRCLEVLSEMHPNQAELARLEQKRLEQALANIIEPPLNLDHERRELVLALRYFEERATPSGPFKVGRYMRARNCFEGRRWSDESRAGQELHNLWQALLVFDRLLWDQAKPTRGAARFLEPYEMIATGLQNGQLVYDFLVFKVRIIGEDLLIDFTHRLDLLQRCNEEVAAYFTASAT